MSKYPATWFETTIGDILQPQTDNKLIHQGWSPRCHSEPADIDEWGVLKTTAIQDGYFLEAYNKKLPEDKEAKPRIEVREGDLLMTNAGPRIRCGVTTLVKKIRGKLMLSGKMYRMRFNEAYIYPNYIEACFRSEKIKKEIDDRKTGMSESGLNLTQERFLTIPIVLCPYNEQIRIANKLDSLLAKVDAAQARLERIPTLLKRFRQSVLAAATSGELTREWDKKGDDYYADIKCEIEITPKLARLEKLSDDEIELAQGFYGEVKWERWKLFALEQLVDPERGIPYGIVQTGDAQEEGIPTVRCGDVLPLSIRIKSLKKVTPEIERNYARTRLVGREVLLAIRGTVGNAAVVTQSLADLNANISREVAMIPVRKKISPDYMALLLQSPGGFKCLAEKVRGVAQKGINLADVKRFVTPLPALDEQLEIVRRVESLFTLADIVEKQFNEAKQRIDRLTQSLLAKAFRGELVPQDPKDEPASEILKRIQSERDNQAALKPVRKANAKKNSVKPNK